MKACPQRAARHIACSSSAILLLGLCLGQTSARAQTSGPDVPGDLYRAGYQAYSRGDLAAAHASFARLVLLAPGVAVGHSAFGMVLLAEGQASEALKQLELARQLDPRTPSTAIAIARAWLALGENGKAATAFLEGVAGGAVLSADESLDYAQALTASGQVEEALRTLKTALETPRDPAFTAAETARLEDACGILLAQRGNFADALALFTAATAADPELASAQAHLGSAELATHQPDAAVEALRRAAALDPGQPAYLIELGRALTASGQYAEAVTVLRRAVGQADPPAASDAKGQASEPATGRAAGPAVVGRTATTPPTNAGAPAPPSNRRKPDTRGPLADSPLGQQARYALALALQASGQLPEALQLFAEYVLIQPGDSQALTNYALALVQTGDARQALDLYRKALEKGPDNATLREDYGVAYLQQSDLDHAIEQFRAGLRLEPENPHLVYDLGLAYKLKDDLARAIPQFEQAEALDATLPDPHYTLGVIHMQQGEFAAAAAEMEKTVALQPGNAAAWSVLGNVYKENADPAKATAALRRAIELDPSQPSTHITLAAILAEAGDKSGAAAERKQAAELSRAAVSRQRASFTLKSGRALLAEGKLNEAEAQLRTSIAADPKDPAPHLALAEALAREGQAADAALEREHAAELTRTAANQAASPASNP
jgi:tetratricopeptide (TPR) repeat protein